MDEDNRSLTRPRRRERAGDRKERGEEEARKVGESCNGEERRRRVNAGRKEGGGRVSRGG